MQAGRCNLECAGCDLPSIFVPVISDMYQAPAFIRCAACPPGGSGGLGATPQQAYEPLYGQRHCLPIAVTALLIRTAKAIKTVAQEKKELESVPIHDYTKYKFH